MKKMLALLSLSLSLWAGAALADVPLIVVHEGTLRDGTGQPVTSATSLTFRLFDDATGGTAFFSETLNVSPEADGSYRAILGQGVSLTSTLLDRSTAFLEIVAGSTVLGPRLEVAAVPYAIRASGADVADVAEVASVALGVDDGAGGTLSFDRLVDMEICLTGDQLYLPGHSLADANGCVDEAVLGGGGGGGVSLPTCSAGQVLFSNGTTLSCIADSTALPTCAAGQVLFSNGSTLSCVTASLAVPSCGANQVLTGNGTSLSCVANGPSLPTCAAGQVLFSNGTTLSCVADSPALPTCAADQVLSSNGSTLSCVANGGAGSSVPGLGANLIDWRYDASAWTVVAGTPTITLNTTDARQGEACFQFANSDAFNTGALTSFGELIPIDPNLSYSGRVAAKLATGAGTFSAGIQAFDRNGNLLPGNGNPNATLFITSGASLSASAYSLFTGNIQGEGTASSQFPVGTRFIRPFVITNAFGGGSPGTGTTRLSSFEIARNLGPNCAAGTFLSSVGGVPACVSGADQFVPGAWCGAAGSAGPGISCLGVVPNGFNCPGGFSSVSVSFLDPQQGSNLTLHSCVKN